MVTEHLVENRSAADAGEQALLQGDPARRVPEQPELERIRVFSVAEQKPRLLEVGATYEASAPSTLAREILWLEALDHRGAPARAAEHARRVLNVTVALIAMVLAAPLMLVVALLVRLSSPGPAIYRQVRVGVDRRRPGSGGRWRRAVDYGGRLFTIYKFRTMRQSPGEDQVWASEEDPRITPVGRFLRRYRLDELPQLINVIRGDMNIVGPRPEQPEIFRRLRDEVSDYPRRQRVLPGITGWAQVNHRYDSCVDDVKCKLEFDLEYMNRRSVTEDLRIMARTVPVMVLRKGAV